MLLQSPFCRASQPATLDPSTLAANPAAAASAASHDATSPPLLATLILSPALDAAPTVKLAADHSAATIAALSRLQSRPGCRRRQKFHPNFGPNRS